ncbi:hypothetical protein JWH16_04595 [Xanthomonas campestris pv. campestris]|uniref:hypothetical protein n=1 Tax=Xanthomonas campestris TaxID=339 RepID=UPI001E4018EF|nr:hypothetical protein [Xanthomonas campestris]MCD0253134.1 hypothetical protein [Xanthomonas campestris pv. campestris]
MEQRNQQPSTKQLLQPAPASSKASGEVVGRYLTDSGSVGVEIRTGGGGFSYAGAWGSGSGLSLGSMQAALYSMLKRYAHTVEIAFLGTCGPIPELGPGDGSWLATSPGGQSLEVYERAHAVSAAMLGWSVVTLRLRSHCFSEAGDVA